jgi:hypothetical protein
MLSERKPSESSIAKLAKTLIVLPAIAADAASEMQQPGLTARGSGQTAGGTVTLPANRTWFIAPAHGRECSAEVDHGCANFGESFLQAGSN